ncbi:hypothetical protein PHYSODRAFT_412758, partial [Phytophthora sojae]
FSDDEDAMLVKLVGQYNSVGGKPNWPYITEAMSIYGIPRKVLQNRLKTLKKTYGKDLSKF